MIKEAGRSSSHVNSCVPCAGAPLHPPNKVSCTVPDELNECTVLLDADYGAAVNLRFPRQSG